MIAGHLVYVRNHFGGLDPEKRPLDMPHVGRPDPRVEASYAVTAVAAALKNVVGGSKALGDPWLRDDLPLSRCCSIFAGCNVGHALAKK